MQQKYFLHIDMNSFFAACEQQANALLRNKPIGVAAYPGKNSILLAASIEAKKLGIKTGTSVRDAMMIYPDIVLLENDPQKYRAISEGISCILQGYSDMVEPYSIDESFVDLTGWVHSWSQARDMTLEIKQRIRSEIGEWLSCSVGISFTKYLAKVGSDMKKPDGLTIITPSDLPGIYRNLELTDLWGIAHGWKKRLRSIGITTSIGLYHYPLQNLVSLFGRPGYYLYAHLHGHEIDRVESEEQLPKSISHQYAIPKKIVTAGNIPKIVMKLCEKVGHRLRAHELLARTIFVWLGSYQHKGHHLHARLPYPIRSTLEIYHHAAGLIQHVPNIANLRIISIGVADLAAKNRQLSFFTPPSSSRRELGDGALSGQIDDIMDEIKAKHGSFSIVHGTMLGGDNFIPDRIAFGK